MKRWLGRRAGGSTGNAGGVNTELEKRIRSELTDKCSAPENRLLFIHPDDARSVLTRERIKELLEGLAWYNEDRRTDISKSMTLILCALIFSNMSDWPDFPTYFYYDPARLESPRYTDRDLPLADVDFYHAAPPLLRRQFLAQQYVFCPVVIRENSHATYTSDYRLPILKAERLGTVSAQGEVKKALIQKRFLESADQSQNFGVKVMACKRITARTLLGQHNFTTEKNILERFKQCTNSNENIMQSFASFIHGDSFFILSPWAAGRDLDIFLRHPDLLENYPENSFRYSPHNLLIEAHNLAQALDFLHRHMITLNGKQLSCAHADLKTDNVLVHYPYGKGPSDLPVGRWMISDFGLSKVEEVFTKTKILPIPDTVQEASKAPGDIKRELSTTPKRGPGAFQPPEVVDAESAKVTTRRDVWSFGCIFAMVLAFALGGPTGVEEQCRERASGTDDYFYRRTNRRSRLPYNALDPASQTPIMDAELKPPFVKWLDTAPDRALDIHRKWIEFCTSLIRKLLYVDVLDRPEIDVATSDLSNIITWTEQYAQDRLWGFEDEKEVVSDIPVHEPPLSDTESTVIIGKPDSSALSSTSTTPPPPTSVTVKSRRSSSSIFQKNDPSTNFLHVTPFENCTGTALDVTGHTAAVWSTSTLQTYILSSIDDSGHAWEEAINIKAKTTINNTISSFTITLDGAAKCDFVQLAGQWVGVRTVAGSTYSIHLYHRPDPISAHCILKRTFKLPSKPAMTTLSALGVMAVHCHKTMHIYMHNGASTAIDFNDKDFLAAAFTTDGIYFCLWERDKDAKGHHYWTIFKFVRVGGQLTMETQGNTIYHQLEPYNPQRLTGSTLLLAFSQYPRFIACDRQQTVYLVRADAPTGQRAHRLARTDTVRAGHVLPDAEGFVLLRGSEHENLKADVCALSSMGGAPSIRSTPAGRVCRRYDKTYYDPAADGSAVRVFGALGEAACLLVLLRSGWLVRKVL